MSLPAQSGRTYPAQLLDDFVALIHKRSSGLRDLTRTALRVPTPQARYILAHAASGGHSSLDELLAAFRSDPTAVMSHPDFDLESAAYLGYLIGLQDFYPTDSADAVAIFQGLDSQFGVRSLPREHQGAYLQLSYEHVDNSHTERLLSEMDNLSEGIRSTVVTDLLNPFRQPGKDTDTWLDQWNHLVPDAELRLRDDSTLAPFDRLDTAETERVTEGPKVTVVITSFQPDQSLFMSVRSIVKQTWANLEIILIDDASPSEYDDILREAASMDDRITLVVQPENRGTYMARNEAISRAQGDFIAFHDSDDWAHPRRIETQVTSFIDNPEQMAAISRSIKADDQLCITQLGRWARILCLPSLIFRREVVDGIGYLDYMRKGADTEFLRRIETVYGDDSVRYFEQLHAIQQQTPNSLSRNDFGAVWRHPARFAYRSAYEWWHNDVVANDPAQGYVAKDVEERLFPATQRLAHKGSTVSEFDVILACDWSPIGGPVNSMLEEIGALRQRGATVGVLHIEGLRWMSKDYRPLCAPIQELINAGEVHQVTLTDHVHTDLFVLRYPPLLQFPPLLECNISSDRVAIMANQPPSELDGSDLRYIPEACTANATELFGAALVWIPQGPQAREALEPYELGPGSAMFDRDMPGVIDTKLWCTPRRGFRSTIPVIGRHGRDHWSKWPADAETLLQAYPDDPDIDFRNMGGTKIPGRIFGDGTIPSNWLSFSYNQMEIRKFLHQLDFWVYFPHPQRSEAFGRAILEAMASGCVVLLPDSFQETFKDGAIYCEPQQVRGIVEDLYGDTEKFLKQSRHGQQVVRENFSFESHVDRLDALAKFG